MKTVYAMTLSAVLLGACWGAPPNQKLLNGLCQDVFVDDAEVTQILAGEAGTDLNGFCVCYAATIVADPVKTSLHKDVTNAIAEARKGTTRGAEDAAEHVEELIQSGVIDTFTEDQLDAVGGDFQRISEEMGENGGACPVPG